MNKKNILLLTSEFPPQPGGIGNHAHCLALALQNEGKKIIVLTDIRSKDGHLENEFDKSLPFLVKRIKRRNIIFISYFDRFFKALTLIKSVDTVIASGKFSLWLVYFLKLFYKKKYIAIVHGSELMLPNKFLRKYTYRCLKKVDRIIAVSNFTKNLISELKLENIIVIPNGFSISEHQTSNLNHQHLESIILITVGNVTQRKGQQNVIQALPLLLKKYPNLRYRIVGIPTEKNRLKSLAKELGVEENVDFYGKVSEKKKCELLVSSSIFIMLSETTKDGDVEGFGIAILEANYYGLPAIGSKGCGIEDAINNNTSGILVDSRNPEEILSSINKINEFYIEFSKDAKRWSEFFFWYKIVKQYIKVIDE